MAVQLPNRFRLILVSKVLVYCTVYMYVVYIRLQLSTYTLVL